MTAEIIPIRPAPSVADFDRFWAAFPKKHKIGPARSQWMWALAKTGNDPEPIIAGAVRYAEYCRRKGTEETYIAPPHQWLADERWHDVYEQPQDSPELSEEARIRALYAQWWTGPDTQFKRTWREQRISEADKAEMRRLGLLQNETAR